MVNLIDQEFINKVSDNIRNCLKDKEDCGNIKQGIVDYLKSLNYNNLPIVSVTDEGICIAINFYDRNNNRLETVEDMIYYMGS